MWENHVVGLSVGKKFIFTDAHPFGVLEFYPTAKISRHIFATFLKIQWEKYEMAVLLPY